MNTDNICTECNGDKNINGFSRTKSICKNCYNIRQRQYCKKYKRNNKEKISEYNKTYKQEHSEEISEYNSKYDKENRETLRVTRGVYRTNRLKTDPNFKMACTLRNRICGIMKLKNSKKSAKTLELLGCSLDFFKTWMEYQFTPEMTFENHGSVWHVDHVTPCSSFDMTDEEQQKICFSWKNMQPLIGSENLSKNGKIINEVIEKHKKKVKKFLKIHNKDN
jgi:hypothetical protein